MPIEVDWENLTPEQHRAVVECLRFAAARGREIRLQRERAIAERRDLETGQRGPLPKDVTVNVIIPDENTRYLGGPEVTVWVQTAEGAAYIIAARNDGEVQIAERVIDEVIEAGIVPYGFPLNEKGICAMFSEKETSHCIWLKHTNMPLAKGAPDDTLPTQAGLIVG
jgi:hypothetical protein